MSVNPHSSIDEINRSVSTMGLLNNETMMTNQKRYNEFDLGESTILEGPSPLLTKKLKAGGCSKVSPFSNKKAKEKKNPKTHLQKTIDEYLPQSGLIPQNFENMNMRDLLVSDFVRREISIHHYELIDTRKLLSDVVKIKGTDDGKRVYIAERNMTISYFDLIERRLIKFTQFETISEDQISCLELSTGNKFLCVGSLFGAYAVYDISNTNCLYLEKAPDKEKYQIINMVVLNETKTASQNEIRLIKKSGIDPNPDISLAVPSNEKLFILTNQKQLFFHSLETNSKTVDLPQLASQGNNNQKCIYREGHVVHISINADHSSIACILDDNRIAILKNIDGNSIEETIHILPIKNLQESSWTRDGLLVLLSNQILKTIKIFGNKFFEEQTMTLREEFTKRIKSWFYHQEENALICSNEEKEVWKYDLREGTKLKLNSILKILFNFQVKAHILDLCGFRGTLGTAFDSYFAIVSVQKIKEDLYQHKAQVSAVAASIDSRFILTGSFDKSLILFDLESRLEVHSFRDIHSRAIRSVAIAPNRNYFVSGSMDGALKIFDFITKKEIASINAHNEAISRVLITSDSLQIITASKDRTIKIFSFDTKKQTHLFKTLHKDVISSMALSPNDRFIISGSGDGRIVVLDSITHEIFHVFRQVTKGIVNCIAISPDTSYFICGNNDGKLKMYSLVTKELTWKYHASINSRITAVEISPNGRYFVSSSADGIVKVFDSSTKFEIQTHDCCLGMEILSLTITQNNRFILIGCADDTVRKIDLDQRERVGTIENAHKEGITSLAISPDGKYIISGAHDNSIKYFDQETGETAQLISRPHVDGVTSLIVSRNNKYLVSGGKDGAVKVFEINTGKEFITFLNAHFGPVLSLCIFSNNNLIASASSDGHIKIFSIRNKASRVCVKKAGGISSISVTPNEKNIIAGCLDRSILVYSIEKEKLINEIVDPHSGSSILSIVTTNECVVSGSADGSIKIFDFKTREEIFHFENLHDGLFMNFNNLKGWVKTMSLSPDERYLVSGSSDRSIKVIDLKTYQKVSSFDSIHHSNSISAVVISQNQKFIISAGEDTRIQILNFPINMDSETMIPRSKILSPYLTRSNPANILKIDDAKEFNKALSIWEDLYYLPHNWNLLHILCLHDPSRIKYLPSYQSFKVPFLLDIYQKTPLHYLLSNPKIDSIMVENLFSYMVDYLEFNQNNLLETESVLLSLGEIIPFIFKFFKSELLIRFLEICNKCPRIPYGEELPRFGFSKNRVITSEKNILEKPSKIMINEGKDPIKVKSVLLSLDHKLSSKDSFNMLMILKDINEEDLFECKAVKKYIDHLWKLHFWSQFGVAALYTGLVILLSLYIGVGDQGNIGLEIAINAVSGLLLLFEIQQLITLKGYYLKNLLNVLDLLILAYIMAIMIYLYDNQETQIRRGWQFSACIFFSYARWIGFLKLVKKSRQFIICLTIVINSLKTFLAIISVIIIGFSLIFLQFEWELDYPIHLLNAYTGLYNIPDLPSTDLTQVLICVGLTLILNVFFLNLLIPIMGNAYDKAMAYRTLLDSKERIAMILDMIALVRVFKKANSKRKFLIYSENTNHHEWKGNLSQVDLSLRRLEKKFSQAIENKNNQISETMQNFEDKLNTTRDEIRRLSESIMEIRDFVKDK